MKASGTAFQFYDLKTGISEERIRAWLQAVPMEKILNKKSSTWRSLSASQQQLAATTESAIQLLQQHTSLIKRPVIELDNKLETIGMVPA